MNKFFVKIFILLLSLNIFSQTKQSSSAGLQEAAKLSSETVKLFSAKKYKEALIPAQRAAAIYEAELGAENVEVARAQRNLAYINYYLDDKSAAQKAFERSLEIYEKQPKLSNAEGLNMAAMMEVLAIIKFGNDKTKTTADLLEKSIAVYEKYGEGESVKAAETWIGLGNLKISEQNFSEAADFYEKALAIKVKKIGRDKFETMEVFNRCLCSLKKSDENREIQRVHQQYFPDLELTDVGTLKSKGKEKEQNTAPDNVPNDGRTLVAIPLVKDIGIVNGIALELPRPAYPVEARRASAEGTVKVSVTINEEGKVIFACGAFNKTHQALRQASENAAYGARFQPSSVNGKPIRVSGVIVYNFIR